MDDVEKRAPVYILPADLIWQPKERYAPLFLPEMEAANRARDLPVQLPLFTDPTVYPPTCDTENPESCEACQ